MKNFSADLKVTIMGYLLWFFLTVLIVTACVVVPALMAELAYTIGLLVGSGLLWLTRLVRECVEAPPPEPIPRSHYVIFKEDYIFPVIAFFSDCFRDLRALDLNGLIVLVTWLTVIGLMTFLLLITCRRFFLRSVYRMRGIDVQYGEATVRDSVFMPMPVPLCQVEIMKPGLLVDSHIGFGFRYRNTLVFPQHVYSAAVANGDILIVGKMGKAAIPIGGVRISNHLTDVCYLDVCGQIWSKIGVQSASIMPDEVDSMSVTVSGPLGTSAGRLSKAQIPWMYFYHGSTVAGYSGAPYMYMGRVVGMHAGVATDHNIGVSAAACAIEIDTFVEGEKAGKKPSRRYTAKPLTDESIAARETMRSGRKEKHDQYWSTHNFLNEDYEEYEHSPDRYELTYDQWRETRGYTSEAASEYDSIVDALGDMNAKLVLEALLRRFNKDGKPSTSYQPQGEVQTFGDIEAGVEESATMESIRVLQEEISLLKQRVERLETVATTKSTSSPQVQGTPGTLKCPVCNRMFKTEDGRAAHAALVHKIICKPESAQPGDSEVLVGTKKHFLGKSQLPRRNGEKSSTTSTTSGTSSHSSPKNSNPVKIKASQKVLEEAFANLQKVILGLLEAPGQ